MIDSQLIITEFKQRVFTESYDRIYKCLKMVSEEQLWSSPNKTITSIGCLIQHLNGNVRQWILSGVGGMTDVRDREKEFIPASNKRKSELMDEMETLKKDLLDFFDNENQIIFTQKIEVQNFNLTVFSAFIHVIEHYSYHTGQITTLTKLYTEKETGYYEGFDLD